MKKDESTAPPESASTEPRTIRLLLSYEGSEFSGWQWQPGRRTVQGALEEAIRHVLDEPHLRIVGAGRTDSGAHALGQVAHVRSHSALAVTKLRAGLNSRLERDLRVRVAEDVGPDFHARFSATGKEYRYHIWQADPVPPFLRRFCLATRGPLDLGAMAEGARLFEGTQDFSAFRASHCVAKSPVRTVFSSRLAAHGSMVVYAIRAPGFLQYMVRNIAGALLQVGKGRLGLEALRVILAGRDRKKAPPTAPAHGLFLVKVEYGSDVGAVEARPEPVLTFGNYES